LIVPVLAAFGVVAPFSPSGNRMSKWYYDTSCLPIKDRAKARSKTFPGIAKAMTEQWAGQI